MSMEPGGRADKFGNRYEYRWLAKQLFSLSREKILAVIHEPVGVPDDGIDLQIFRIDGAVELQQCKSSNGSQDNWRFGNLNKNHIFSRAKKHLDAAAGNRYALVSPLHCKAIEDLIDRAKNADDNPQMFYRHQISTTTELKRNFCKFLHHMNLLPNDSVKDDIGDDILCQGINYLRRIEFILFSDSDHEKQDLIDRISDVYSSKPEEIYNLLYLYTTDDRFGHKITAPEINLLLAAKCAFKRDLSNDGSIGPRINALNDEFKKSFRPIQNEAIPRAQTEKVFEHISSGYSVLLHGSAGSGKSGCIQELIVRLENEDIPYLAVKLDKRTPGISAEKYGKDVLDLPASPVYCLSQLSAGGKAVLILDQLDALRWTARHSKTAIDVCWELINQAKRKNEDGQSVSIVLICRTFDIENDSDFKALTETESSVWKKEEVSELLSEDVKKVVGALYDSFSANFKKLLSNVNNLYIWSRLSDEYRTI